MATSRTVKSMIGIHGRLSYLQDSYWLILREEFRELKPHFEHLKGVNRNDYNGCGDYDWGRLVKELVENDLSKVMVKVFARSQLVVAKQDSNRPKHRHGHNRRDGEDFCVIANGHEHLQMVGQNVCLVRGKVDWKQVFGSAWRVGHAIAVDVKWYIEADEAGADGENFPYERPVDQRKLIVDFGE